MHNKPHTEEAKDKIRKKQKAWRKTQAYKDFVERQRERAKTSPTKFKKGHKPHMDGQNLLEYQKGSNHWNWKGGIYPKVMSLRGCQKYLDWRTSVFERDNYTCQICGERGGYVEADHYPIPFCVLYRDSNYEVMWDISNGRTLCKSCHNKTKKFWKETYNVEQKQTVKCILG